MSGGPVPLEAELTLLRANLVTNRRAAVRYKCHLATPGRFVEPPFEFNQYAWVINVSTTGLGLMLGRPLEGGTHVVLQIRCGADAQVHELAGKVAHSSAQVNGDWLIGVALDRALTPDEIEDLLE